MDPEIVSIGKGRIEDFVAADPSFMRFSFGFTQAFRQTHHTLSAHDERSLASHEQPFDLSAIPHRQVTLSSGKSVHVDDAGFNANRGARSRDDRRLLYNTYYGDYVSAEGMIATPLLHRLQKDKERAHKQGFAGSLAAKLYNENIPEAVYTQMVAQVQDGLPSLHRYYDLQRRRQKLPRAELFDLDFSFSSYQKNFSLAEMRVLALQACAPLGRQYGASFTSALTARWMDPFAREGKAQGNRTDPSAYDVHPYLLLNLRDSYPDLSLFTHEWGHAMHAVLARHAQPFDTYLAPVFLQEVASTLNEILLSHLLVTQARTREEKLFYLQARLRLIATVFYEQAMLAEFEATIHERIDRGEALSGSSLTDIFYRLLTRYYGPSVSIKPVYGARWVFYAPYLFDPFYLFQYSTSIAAAAHFASSILKGGEGERNCYLKVLASGGSDYGYSTLLEAGLDLETPDAYQAIKSLFTETLNDAQSLLQGHNA